MASEQYLVAELGAKQFEVYFKKIEILIFFLNTQICFAYISVLKCHSEAVLYSKRTAGYPLSPHIKTIAVTFFKLSNKATKKLSFENFEKKKQFWAYGVHPRFCLKAET